MISDMLLNEYFEWLCDFTHKEDEINRYNKVLQILHGYEFEPIVDHDENRAQDGVELRRRFSRELRCRFRYNSPCSVLEMMVALALRCEEQIMWDPDIGDRTSEWFHIMLHNLGLDIYTDDLIDHQAREEIDGIINTFLDRKYKRNGEGGLFKIDKCKCDLRSVEIWYQMCWYLDELM